MGSPTTFTPAIGRLICTRIAKGEPLTRICESIETSPGKSLAFTTVYRWLDNKCDGKQAVEREIFRQSYARARLDQAHSAYFEIQEIERKMQLPRKIKDPDQDPQTAGMIANPDYIEPNTGRVLVDSIKWRAGRMMPKTYGDKIDVGVSGDVNITVKDAFK